MWKSLAVVAALSVFATSADARPRQRETAKWLSLGGVIGSAALAGTGAMMAEYTLTGGRGYDLGYEGTRRAGEGLMIAGAVSTVITPSLGDWYAGEYFTTGVKLRAAGLGIGLVGLGYYYGSEKSCSPSLFGSAACEGGTPPDARGASMVWVVGGALYLSGIVYDVVHAPTAADRANEHFQVMPAVIPTQHGVVSGVGIGGKF
jgi:hypothetical protein